MRFVTEYRDRGKANALAGAIAELCEPGRHYKLMEVCGGHTHTIYKHGLEHHLPEAVELVHGPGCPVCVIPMGRVDDAISIAHQPGVTLACFGDMMRVPGGKGSFLDAKAAGADVRVVYSPMDALKLAVDQPDQRVVFVAIGFETTAPSTALTLLRAQADRIANFSVFCNHVTIIPPLKAILDANDVDIDGFIGPGHVSTVIGCRPYLPIATDYGKPMVVSGFEPLDVLQSVYMVMRQLSEHRAGPGREALRGGQSCSKRRRLPHWRPCTYRSAFRGCTPCRRPGIPTGGSGPGAPGRIGTPSDL